MKPELNTVPRLAPGVRLDDKNAESRTLLMPERVFKLNNTSFEIIRLCDGEHTVQQIAEKLQKVYSAAEPQRIADDVFEYLASLRDERAIDF